MLITLHSGPMRLAIQRILYTRGGGGGGKQDGKASELVGVDHNHNQI